MISDSASKNVAASADWYDRSPVEMAGLVKGLANCCQKWRQIPFTCGHQGLAELRTSPMMYQCLPLGMAHFADTRSDKMFAGRFGRLVVDFNCRDEACQLWSSTSIDCGGVCCWWKLVCPVVATFCQICGSIFTRLWKHVCQVLAYFSKLVAYNCQVVA